MTQLYEMNSIDVMKARQMIGQSDAHLAEIFPGHFVHSDVVEPYLALVARAADSGVDLRLASGYRSFDRQLTIWNAKVSGQRPVCDDRGTPLDLNTLTDLDKVNAILRWSALPGASRHHWGTDVDVWDRAAVETDYCLQLVPGEYAGDGVFFRLTRWLDEMLANGESGFFRPYTVDDGGVGVEPWHLSFRPVAADFEQLMNQRVLRETLEQADILLKKTVLDNFATIYQRYVLARH